MGRRALVVGVGMIPFSKPGRSDEYDVMAAGAVQRALKDAGVEYSAIQQAFAGYVYGNSTCGQRALYRVGMTGIPVINVNNNCASGSTALWLANQAIASGAAECVLVVGFEQMKPGALTGTWLDRATPLDRFVDAMDAIEGGPSDTPVVMRFFGAAGAEYIERYGARPETFAKVSVKARRHAAGNPYAVFRDPVTEQEVLASPQLYGPVTRLQACPPTCGAAAAVVCSEAYARAHGLRTDVAIAAQAMVTDVADTFDRGSMATLVGAEITREAACQVYESAGVDPKDIQVVELHDCFTVNEVLSYEALGLCEEGGAEKFILDGDNTYGGRVVVNPSGGLQIGRAHV